MKKGDAATYEKYNFEENKHQQHVYNFLENQEIIENTPFCRSAKSFINIRFWEVFSGPKRKSRIFALLGAKIRKNSFFAPRGTFCAPNRKKVKKSDQKWNTCRSSLERIYIRFARGTFCSKTHFCVFPVLERKKRKSAPKTENPAPKRKNLHIFAFSRK